MHITTNWPGGWKKSWDQMGIGVWDGNMVSMAVRLQVVQEFFIKNIQTG